MRFKNYLQLNEWFTCPNDRRDELLSTVLDIKKEQKIIEIQIKLEKTRNQIIKLLQLLSKYQQDKTKFPYGEDCYSSEITFLITQYIELYKFNKENNNFVEILPIQDILQKLSIIV
jgi:hypothetical protein